MSEYIAVKLRELVKSRAHHLCEYCRSLEEFSSQPFCFEHILPKVAGGETTSENLAYACQGCNAFKATRTEYTDEISDKKVNLFNPRESKWSDHFAWNVDFTEVLGITPEGRATVKALKLNRVGLINLRRVLFGIGKHPPDEE